MIYSKAKKKNTEQGKEDPKTSFFFETLLMLPDDLFCEIMSEATGGEDIKEGKAGKLLNYEFWPSWDVKDIGEIKNKNYVEPDLFIQFENIDLIIEAKRSDEEGQFQDQWNNELTAYNHSKSLEDKRRKIPLVFIAIGGNVGTNNEAQDLVVKHQKCRVNKTSWVKLLHCAKNKINEKNEPQVNRLLNFFEYGCNNVFNVRDYKWFESLFEYEIFKQ